MANNLYEGPRTYLYKIDVDPLQWTLRSTYLKQKKADAFDINFEEQNWSVLGYYPSLELLVHSGLQKAIRQELKHKTEDLTGIQNLHDQITEITTGFIQAVNRVESNFLDGEYTNISDGVKGRKLLEALDRHRERLQSM